MRHFQRNLIARRVRRRREGYDFRALSVPRCCYAERHIVEIGTVQRVKLSLEAVLALAVNVTAAAAHPDAPRFVPNAHAVYADLFHAFTCVAWQSAFYGFILPRDVIVILDVHSVEVIRLIRHHEVIGQRLKHYVRVVNVVERGAPRLVAHWHQQAAIDRQFGEAGLQRVDQVRLDRPRIADDAVVRIAARRPAC
ncbi:hypothetical protein D3C72_1766190 [compost metagenome]